MWRKLRPVNLYSSFMYVVQVFKGITDRELNVLDIFEDEEYVKRTVEISLTVSLSLLCT